MPRASKQLLENKLWTQIQKAFIDILSSQGESNLNAFLSEFFTREEKIMFPKRLAVYLLILNGYADSEIKELLKISYETVRTLRVSLETKSENFKKNLKMRTKFERPRPKNKFLKMISIALEAKSNVKERAK